MAPSQQLINYVLQNKNLGYSDATIRAALAASGYTQGDINAAFSYTSPGGSSSGTPPILVFAIILIGVLFLFGAVAMFIMGDGSDEPDVYVPDVDLEPVTKPPVVIKDPEKKPVVTQPKEDQEENIPPPVSTGTGSTTLTRFEIDRQVASLAVTNPDKAAQLCVQITTRAGQLSCYHKIADISQEEKYCEMIDDDVAKDSCYVNLAVAQVGTVAICDKIKDEFKSKSCVTLYGAHSYELTAEQKDALANASVNIPTPPLSESDLQNIVNNQITIETQNEIVNTQVSSLDDEVLSDTQTTDQTTDTPATEPQVQPSNEDALFE
ncbi:MAG TPA: hypothetical protein VK158_06160 [Acidobacteriota bacterium]|nr:hypothetical protein [Acidobacteriota bacterium]